MNLEKGLAVCRSKEGREEERKRVRRRETICSVGFLAIRMRQKKRKKKRVLV